MPTKPFMIRLTEADLEKLRVIRDRYGFINDASAIRFAVYQAANRVDSPRLDRPFPNLEIKTTSS